MADQHYDVVILGSGAAGLATAVTAASLGLRVLVLERDACIGGTSAISGGSIWIPDTRQAKAGGFRDTADNARTYLRHVLGENYNAGLVDAFLDRGPDALAFLEDHADLKYTVRALSPDYYPELPGATDQGRSLEVGEFDGRRLGPWFERLRAPQPGMMLFGGLMLSRWDIQHFLNFRRSLVSLWHCIGLLLRFAKDRMRHSRGTRLVIGNAMVASLLKAALDKNVAFALCAETLALRTDAAGRINGITARLQDGKEHAITARAVVLAGGGMGQSSTAQADRPDTRSDHLSMSAPKADGSLMRFAEGLGAQRGGNLASSFYWAPMSQARHADGKFEIFPHIVTDRAKPGVIAVTQAGVRFTNEADSYHRFTLAMQAQQRRGNARFYLIADSRAVRAYGLGLARPWPGNNRALVKSGYLITAPTIAALALQLSLDPAALEETIRTFTADATRGEDLQFHKGASSYNRAMGDASAAYPCLAPLVKPPFFAVRVHTGDLGSARGLVTDAKARVLRADGSAIAGLYAVGNDMNSMTAGHYPGPGITLGPALTFAYLAARDIAQRQDDKREETRQ